MVLNLWVPWTAGKFLSSWATGSFWRRVQAHEVSYLTTCRSILLEKLIIVQLLKTLSAFYELEHSLLHLQESTTGRYLVPDESSQCSNILLFVLQFLLLGSLQGIRQRLRRCLIFCNTLIFLCYGVVSATSSHQAGGPPLVFCSRLLIEYACSCPPSTAWGDAMPWWQGTHLTWDWACLACCWCFLYPCLNTVVMCTSRH
jgi:hypothetical protein